MKWKKHRNVHEEFKDIYELFMFLNREDDGRYLYRGQNGIFSNDGDITRQIPRIYRRCKSKEESNKALKDSYCLAFWLLSLMVNNNSIMDLAGRSGFQMNDHEIEGDIPHLFSIAQHYGIPTEFLDLTNLKPAAVFATQEWQDIRTALNYPQGHIFPVKNQVYGFIFRYNIKYLEQFNLPIIDLANGKFGARPIIQEGKVIPIQYNQDIDMLESGVYEIFPFFHNKEPYCYEAPISLSQEFCENTSLYSAHTLLILSKTLTKNKISVRDLVSPPFYFANSPSSPDVFTAAFGIKTGHTGDPYLSLGLHIEKTLPEIKSQTQKYEDYAKLAFKKYYGHPLINTIGKKQYSISREKRFILEVQCDSKPSEVDMIYAVICMLRKNNPNRIMKHTVTPEDKKCVINLYVDCDIGKSIEYVKIILLKDFKEILDEFRFNMINDAKITT